MSRLMPMLAYDDAPAAIAFLCRAFGFSEKFRFDLPDGTIGHAELRRGDARVAIATTWEVAGMAPPCRLSGVHGQLYCEVDDVDAHYECALAGGAVIAQAPGRPEHGSRSYRAIDPEGHRWVFATPHEED